jgi:cytochrome c5
VTRRVARMPGVKSHSPPKAGAPGASHLGTWDPRSARGQAPHKNQSRSGCPGCFGDRG